MCRTWIKFRLVTVIIIIIIMNSRSISSTDIMYHHHQYIVVGFSQWVSLHFKRLVFVQTSVINVGCKSTMVSLVLCKSVRPVVLDSASSNDWKTKSFLVVHEVLFLCELSRISHEIGFIIAFHYVSFQDIWTLRRIPRCVCDLRNHSTHHVVFVTVKCRMNVALWSCVFVRHRRTFL